VVLLVAIWAVARAFAGWLGGRPWTPRDEVAGRWFRLTLNVQMLAGLLLYLGISPITRAAFSDFGGAMGDSVLRFWAIEHLFGMLAAVALAHVGRARARRSPSGPPRHRTCAIFYGLALLVILISIPWPMMLAGRPLVRW
jgi:hypothetical protein